MLDIHAKCYRFCEVCKTGTAAHTRDIKGRDVRFCVSCHEKF